MERLEQPVATINEAKEPAEVLIITRVYNAPRNLVFKAWTEAEHLAEWWGPKGFKMNVCNLDLHPGGHFHYGMQTPDGNRMWGLFVYQEIVAPEKIVFVNSFSDEQGNITRNPWSEEWPLEILNTLTLTDEGEKTTLTLKGYPINATDIELKTFAAGRASMQQGFAGTLNQLAEFLAGGKMKG